MNDGAQDSLSIDENVRFLDEGVSGGRDGAPWKVMIADDDIDVHLTTKLVLKDFRFRGRGIEFLDAYDGSATCELLRANPDTAVLLLDVVMESTDAGLNAIRRIRDEIGNRLVRIILRTGQPGHAPEREVVLKYHINDYKAKSELTADKLFTALVSALRLFEDLRAVDSHRAGLAKVLDAAGQMDFRSRSLFACGLLTQLGTLLGAGGANPLLLVRRRHEDGRMVIVAAVGHPDYAIGAAAEKVLDAESIHYLEKVFSDGVPHIDGRRSIFPVPLPDLATVAIHIGGARSLDASEQALIELFCGKIMLAHRNFEFVEDGRVDQYAEIALLATVSGRASFLTIPYIAGHGRLSRDIARHLGEAGSLRAEDSRFPELIERAAMFADIGNDGLPAGLLEKPAEFSASERALMRTHPERGHRLLQELQSAVPVGRVIGLAREVALTHHERVDGTGYPSGLKGRNIPLAGRIVAVANSYTAMTSNRPWRAAFTHDQALETLRAESGTAFDPEIIDALVAVVDGFRQRKAV